MNLERMVLAWQNLAREALVPGFAIAVLEPKNPVWNAVYGVAKAEIPVTINTIFEAASLSKQVVALATLKLCHEGLLELDKPLIQYLPDPNLEHDARLGLITIRHVLSHTSGLPNWLPEGEIATTQFQPGERFSYSGTGFYKLQRVLEQITGSTLEEHLQEAVFKPLGMQDSSFIWREDFAGRVAFGHDKHGAVMPKSKPVQAHAAYSLHSTVGDLARFLQECLQPSSISLTMQEPQIAINENISWGLGWGLEECVSGKFFWQWGHNPGFRALMVGSSNTGFGVVVLTNGTNGDKLWKSVLTDLTGIAHPALAWLEGS